MRILALVPARGGSKRLPGKNARSLHGRPLVVWSIAAAQGVSEVCDILVSTDDPAIAKIAKDAGALVPWLRPSFLATDEASSVDVALHALSWYEDNNGSVDGLLLLQPTSPFRKQTTIMRSIAIFREHDRNPVVSLSPVAVHPLWCFFVTGPSMRPYVDGAAQLTRSQDLPPVFALNGSLFLIAPETLRSQRSFVTANAVPLIIDSSEESIDIDTESDWRVAAAYGKQPP